MRIIKLNDGDAFCGYDDERCVYLFSVRDGQGRLNFEATMTCKLIENNGLTYHLQKGGLMECRHNKVSEEWLVANSVHSKRSYDAYLFGLEFCNECGFKACNQDRIEVFFRKQALTPNVS